MFPDVMTRTHADTHHTHTAHRIINPNCAIGKHVPVSPGSADTGHDHGQLLSCFIRLYNAASKHYSGSEQSNNSINAFDGCEIKMQKIKPLSETTTL